MIHNFDMDSSFLITDWVDKPTAYMKVMDVGCLLSRWEGFGLVLPECMACGVPIVATNVDAIPNIVKTNENGILINKDSCVDAQRACITIKNNICLKNKIVSPASVRVKQQFNGIRVAKESIDLYKNLER
ncbi:MAG: glycosyltransferase [Lactobacillus helveticus]